MEKNELRTAILEEIARRAPMYTPEWRFDPKNPDAGTALAMIWADMHSETLERFGQLPDNYKRALFDAIGSQPKPAVSASGYLAFAVRSDAGEIVIPRGTVVAAPSEPDAALATYYDLAASPLEISDIFCVIPERDSVVRLESRSEIELFGTAAGGKHIWTFVHDFALDVSSKAVLKIEPHLEGGSLNMLAVSKWEYRDGGAWHELTVIADENALICRFPKDKTYCDAVRVSVLEDALLSGIFAKPYGYELLPDALYYDSAEEKDGFYPIGQRFLPGACAYFSNIDALSKPGARVELAFALSFDYFEIEGYAETQMHMKRVMRADEYKPPREYTVTAAETKWEYYNGVGWAALTVDAKTELFNGESAGRIRVSFLSPADLQTAVVGAHDLPFIRVRLISAENLFRQRGHYKAPRISDIRFGYKYLSGVPITDITASEHLDEFSKTLPAQLAAPPDGPCALYFAAERPFTSGAILFYKKPGELKIGSRWEYMSDKDWAPLSVRDGTEGLSKTGVLGYQVDSPAISARLWGKNAYWIRLVLDETVTPRALYLYGIYENAVRAKSVAAGRTSVLPAGAFTTILAPVSGVESAFNPIATYGGAEMEDEARILTRMSASLSNNGRAVSRSDCEELALEASRSVLRAKLYPHTDENGNDVYGTSCLVIQSRDEQEYGFSELCGEITAYIEPRRPLGSDKLVIIPPRLIAVNISAGVVIDNKSEALNIKDKIESALSNLLSPQNWDIGQLPTPGQINVAIRAVSGVLRLSKTEVSYTMTTGKSADYVKAVREAFILPATGRFELVFTEEMK